MKTITNQLGAFNKNYIGHESRGDKDKNLSLEEYLDIIRPYLKDIINNHKGPIKLKDPADKIIEDDLFGEWKMQLTMRISFVSFLDFGEIRIMNSKSENVEITMGNETDDIIKELFWIFFQTYQEGLEKKLEKSHFIFESVDLLHYSLHKTRLRRGKSCIKSPKWLENKRATINPKNEKDDKCF